MGISVFDFETQLSFYGQYHHNVLNKWIHIVCVPLIYWSSLVFGAYFSPVFGHWFLERYGLPLNLSTIVTILYSSYFIILEPLSGFLYLPILLFQGYYANEFLLLSHVDLFNFSFSPIQFAIILHVVCWIAQFVGHGVAEGRAPALLDNLLQAIVLAPFFVFIELLFMFGYKPKLQEELETHVLQSIKEWKSQSNSKKAK